MCKHETERLKNCKKIIIIIIIYSWKYIYIEENEIVNVFREKAEIHGIIMKMRMFAISTGSMHFEKKVSVKKTSEQTITNEKIEKNKNMQKQLSLSCHFQQINSTKLL